MAGNAAVEMANELAGELYNLSNVINKNSEERSFSDIWDWQAPSVSKADISHIAYYLAKKVEAFDWSSANEDTQAVLSDLCSKVKLTSSRNAANLLSGFQAGSCILNFLYAVEVQVGSLISLDQIKGAVTVPVELRKSVGAARGAIEKIFSEIEGIEGKIKLINSAHDAAQKLPVTQNDLEFAIQEVNEVKERILSLESESRSCSQRVAEHRASLEQAAQQAGAVLQKVNKAYSAATSQALAKAFAEKSEKLNKSLMLWVLILIASLTAGGILAFERFPRIIEALSGKPDWSIVLINAFLGVLTVAPAVWLAWISTTQIGQRFRLSEDYGYKAALAAAYEGYRSEASRLDPMFEAQLFATALGRLDEIPLRLVSADVPGSPMHELFNSKEFKQALEVVPNLRDRVLGVFRNVKGTPDTSAVSAASEPSKS